MNYFLHAFRKHHPGSTLGVLFSGVYFWSFTGMLLLDGLLAKNAELMSPYLNIQENRGILETLCGFLRITSLCVLNVILCLLGNAVHLILHNEV